MKLGHVFVLGLAGVLCCDVWLAMGAPAEGRPAVAGEVSLLGLLQVGPALPAHNLRGGADCDCHGVASTGKCEAETNQTCSSNYSECEAPTDKEACTTTIEESTTIRDCNASGCVSHDARISASCTTKEKCAGD